MLRAVDFDTFSYSCQFFNDDLDINGGYGCNNSEQDYKEEKRGVEYGCCDILNCPFGFVAEQQDLTDKEDPDAVKDDIDWDGLCKDGEVEESEYLLVEVGEMATEEQRQAMRNYDLEIHKYDKKWIDEHSIENSLCS